MRAGDDVHVVCGHTRWTAAATEVVRQWWGRDPGFTLVDAAASRRLGTLFVPGRAGPPRSSPATRATSSRTSRRTRSSRGAYLTAPVEVEHWSFLAFPQRLEAAARGLPADDHPLDRGLVDGGQRRRSPWSTRRSVRSACSQPHAPDVALVHARGRRPGRQRRLPPAAARGRLGRAGRPARRDRDRRADRRRHPAVGPSRAAARPPGARRCRVPDGRAPRWAVRPLHAGRAATARTSSSGPRCATPAARDDFDEWIRDWVLDVDRPRRLPRRGSEPNGRPRCGPGRPRLVAGRRGRPSARPRRAGERVGARGRVRGARTWPSGSPPSGPTPCSPGPAWPTWRPGWACGRPGRGARLRADRRARPLGLRADAGRPVRVQPPRLPVGDDAADSSEILGMVMPGPGHHVRWPASAAPSSTATATSTPPRSPVGRSSSGCGGGNDVASVADEVVVVTPSRRSGPSRRCRYVTSPGAAVSHLVTDLGTFEKRDGRFVLTAVAGADAVSWPASTRATSSAGGTGRRRRVVELEPPTADEVEALRRWDPRGLLPQGLMGRSPAARRFEVAPLGAAGAHPGRGTGSPGPRRLTSSRAAPAGGPAPRGAVMAAQPAVRRQPVERREPGGRAVHHGHRHDAVERHHRARARPSSSYRPGSAASRCPRPGRASSCTAAIAACSWYGPIGAAASVVGDELAPSAIERRVPPRRGPARRAAPAAVAGRCAPAGGRRSAASAPAGRRPRRRRAAARAAAGSAGSPRRSARRGAGRLPEVAV